MRRDGKSGEDIRVSRSEFSADPERYMRKATGERRVLVCHDGSGKVSTVFGGVLNTPASMPAELD